MTAADVTPEMAAARAKLAGRFAAVRTGGAGSTRRKRVAHHAVNQVDDKKLQGHLKRLGMSSIPGIDEVNMFKADNKVLHFPNPKMQAAIQANTFSISGPCQEKNLEELLPGILSQLGPEAIMGLKDIAAKLSAVSNQGSKLEEDDDEVPDLVADFEEVSKEE